MPETTNKEANQFVPFDAIRVKTGNAIVVNIRKFAIKVLSAIAVE